VFLIDLYQLFVSTDIIVFISLYI